MRTLTIIPARGGSKGIPGKNIRPFAGKPLILHTLELARRFAADKDICISTDSPEIAAVADSAGYKVPFIRPESLATDQSGMYEVLLHALKHYQASGSVYERILLLQPTSPFRLPEHIESAFALFSPSVDMVVSVKESKSNPYFVLFEENSEGYLEKSKQGNFLRRQDCPPVWEYNGAIYVINVRSLLQSPLHEFKKVVKFVMDELHSADLDTPSDWEYAEFLNAKHRLLPL